MRGRLMLGNLDLLQRLVLTCALVLGFGVLGPRVGDWGCRDLGFGALGFGCLGSGFFGAFL